MGSIPGVSLGVLYAPVAEKTRGQGKGSSGVLGKTVTQIDLKRSGHICYAVLPSVLGVDMSLSLADREKLLRTAQNTFPLANQWKQLKKKFKENCPSLEQRKQTIWVTIVCALGGALGVSALVNGPQMFEFFAVVLAVMGPSTAAWGAGALLSQTYGAQKLRTEIKNKVHHQAIRQYIVQKTALRHFKEALPQLSNQDLEVMVQLPNLSSDCKKILDQELARRAHEQMTQMFLNPTVEVETPGFTTNSHPTFAKSLTV